MSKLDYYLGDFRAAALCAVLRLRKDWFVS